MPGNLLTVQPGKIKKQVTLFHYTALLHLNRKFSWWRLYLWEDLEVYGPGQIPSLSLLPGPFICKFPLPEL